MSEGEIIALRGDQSELRRVMSSMEEKIDRIGTAVTEVGGKVELSLALLEKATERQGRNEIKVEELDRELRYAKEKFSEQRDADRREFDSKIDKQSREFAATKNRVMTWGGGLAVIAFAMPFLINFLLNKA